MYDIERLIAAGMSADTAWETAYWFRNYATEGDFDRYILEFERGQRGRPVDG